MNVAATPSSSPALSPAATPVETRRLEVSRYEHVASMLIAMLVLIGFAVLLLLAIWFSNRMTVKQSVVGAEFMELGEGEGGPAGGQELAGDIQEEIGQETDLEEPTVENMIASVADALSARESTLENPLLSEEVLAGRGGGSRGDGRGVGQGSGDGTGGSASRELHFAAGMTREAHARQLDAMQIELGILNGDRYFYASNLSKPRPDSREGPAAAETRYHFTLRASDVQAAMRELLQRAGYRGRPGTIRLFIPPSFEPDLANKERARAGSDVDIIRRTRFGIRPQGNNYEFYVIDQTYY